MTIGFYFNTPKSTGGAYQYSLLFLDALTYIKNNTYIIFNTTHDIPDRFYTQKNFLILDISGPFSTKQSRSYAHISNMLNLIVTAFLRFHMGYIVVFFYKWLRRSTLDCINSSKTDLIVFPLTTMETFGCKIPYILAVHDLQHKVNPQFKELTGSGQSEIRDLRYNDEVKHAFRLLAQSQCGKADIIRYYGANPDKIRILPYSPIFSFLSKHVKGAAPKKYRLPKHYVFYPANYWSHKNHKNLIRAIGILVKKQKEIHVILTGTKSVDFSIQNELNREIKKLHVDTYVHHLGYLTPEELKYIYIHAIALAMPTYIGPVNLPVYEAWSLGTPVITSDIRDYREIASDAALLIDPDSPGEIADAIVEIQQNKKLRKKLGCHGRTIIHKRTIKNFARNVNTVFGEYINF